MTKFFTILLLSLAFVLLGVIATVCAVFGVWPMSAVFVLAMVMLTAVAKSEMTLV